MANWQIWPMDRAINTTNISASHNPSHAARVADLDQITSWAPGVTGSAVKIYGDLGQAYTLGAIGFGNCVDMSGRTIQIYRSTTVLGTLDTLQISVTAPAYRNFVVTFTQSGGDIRYWAVNLPGGASATTSIGTISVLDVDEVLSIASPAAPSFPGMSLDPGFAAAQLATGNPITQILGGPIRTLSLTLNNTPATQGALYHDVLDSLENNYGWARGVWITDDTLSSNVGIGYYGLPLVGQPIIGQTSPGPYGEIQMNFQLMPLGV